MTIHNITEAVITDNESARLEMADVGERVFSGDLSEMEGFIWIAMVDGELEWGYSCTLEPHEVNWAFDSAKMDILLTRMVDDD